MSFQTFERAFLPLKKAEIRIKLTYKIDNAIWMSKPILYSSLRSGAWQTKQDAQLSQWDRAAGCVIVYAKSRTLEMGDNILRTL